MAARSHVRRPWVLAPVAVVLTLLAPACGGDDAASPATDDAANAATAPTSGAPTSGAPTSGAPTSGTATSGTPTDDGAADTATPATDTPAATSAPIELLSFSAPLIGGGTFDGATYATERPVALWFWAPT